MAANEKVRRVGKPHISCAGREFVMPMGVRPVEGENFVQREEYDCEYLADDATPRYQYTIAVSSDRLPALFHELCRLMPQTVSPIVELPGPEETGREVCDIWTGPPVSHTTLRQAFDAHSFLVAHDGMIGFGAFCVDNEMELFVDEHKLVYFMVSEMDGADEALAGFGIPYTSSLRHFSCLSHVHYSLTQVSSILRSGTTAEDGQELGMNGEYEDYVDAVEELAEELGLKWQESRDYV